MSDAIINLDRLSGTNLERAADYNQRVTLHAIRINGSLTRIELARITGLTAPAIANITKRLASDGLIREDGRRRGGRGQPPRKLVINPSAVHSIGVNIDRDHITIVIVDFLGNTVARVSHEMSYALPSDVSDLYRSAIQKMVRKSKIDPSSLVGIGIAIPDDLGMIDLPGRPVGYEAWNTTDMAAMFGTPFDLPVFVENDAAAATMGEMQLGRGQNLSSFFYVLVSSGLGGGLAIDGNYVHGATGRSGEIGFLRSPDSKQIQSVVSISGLLKHLSASGLTFSDLQDLSSVSSIEEVTNRWIEQVVTLLIQPMISINCLINPAAILIGGRLPGIFVERLATRLNESLEEFRSDFPAIAPVERAQLSEDAPAVGAAILPLSHFLLPRQAALWKSTGMLESSGSTG